MATMRKRNTPAGIPSTHSQAKPAPGDAADDGPLTPEQTKQLQEEAYRLSSRPVGPPRRIKSLF